MPDVIAWPPVSLTGFEHTISRPMQRAEGLSGTPHYSQAEPTRRLISAIVPGLGTNRAGAGYIEMLKRLLDGKPPLVRITPCPQHWIGATAQTGLRGQTGMTWTTEGVDLNWTSGGVAMNWFSGAPIAGTAGTDADGSPYLDCTGLPANQVVAYPSEIIRSETTTARVINRAVSGPGGFARIFTDAALPSGNVTIGLTEPSVAVEITEFPRAVQPVTGQGNWAYRFNMREVFANEFADGFNEVTPRWT